MSNNREYTYNVDKNPGNEKSFEATFTPPVDIPEEILRYNNAIKDGGTVGSRIKSLRQLDNYTTSQFGQRMGVSSGTVSNWESGKIEPPLVALKALCYEYNVSLRWLQTGETEENPTDAVSVNRKRLQDWISNMSGDDVMALTRIMRSFALPPAK